MSILGRAQEFIHAFDFIIVRLVALEQKMQIRAKLHANGQHIGSIFSPSSCLLGGPSSKQMGALLSAIATALGADRVLPFDCRSWQAGPVVCGPSHGSLSLVPFPPVLCSAYDHRVTLKLHGTLLESPACYLRVVCSHSGSPQPPAWHTPSGTLWLIAAAGPVSHC